MINFITRAGGVVLLLLFSLSALAITEKELIVAFYKNCDVEYKTALLDEERSKFMNSSLYSYYLLNCKEREPLRIFPVTHHVKIGPQKLLVVTHLNGKIERIIQQSFVGGSHYRPTSSWYQKFVGVHMNMGGSVDALSGATYTTKSTREILHFVSGVNEKL